MASSREQFEQQHNVKTFPRGSKGEEEYTDIQIEQIDKALNVLRDESKAYGYIRRMKMMSSQSAYVALDTFGIQCPVKPEIQNPEGMIDALEEACGGKIAVSYDATKRIMTFDSMDKGNIHPDEATKIIANAAPQIRDIVSGKAQEKTTKKEKVSVPETPDDISQALFAAKRNTLSSSFERRTEFARRLGELDNIVNKIDFEGLDKEKITALEDAFNKAEEAEPIDMNDRKVNIALQGVKKYIRTNKAKTLRPTTTATIPDNPNPDADREIWDQNPSALCAFSASLDRYKTAAESSGVEIPDIAKLQSIMDDLAAADRTIRTDRGDHLAYSNYLENLDALRNPKNKPQIQSILEDMENKGYITSEQFSTVHRQTISNQDAMALLAEARQAGVGHTASHEVDIKASVEYRASHDVDIKEELGNLPVPPKKPQAESKKTGRF